MPSHIDNSIVQIPEDIAQTIPAWDLSVDPRTSLDSHRVSDCALYESMLLAWAIDLSDADYRGRYLSALVPMLPEHRASSDFIFFVASMVSLFVVFLLSLFSD
jgi:hypothetical protein